MKETIKDKVNGAYVNSKEQQDLIDAGHNLAEGSVTSFQNFVLVIAIFIILILVASYLIYRRRSNKKITRKDNGLFKSKNILTKNETEFYGRLTAALPDYVVLAQVSMGAVIEPRTDDPKEYMRRRMMFSQKIIDFVICKPKTLEIVCIVELDDITHDKEKDAKRDAMTKSAGYTTIRWHSRSKPSVVEISKTVKKLDGTSRSLWRGLYSAIVT